MNPHPLSYHELLSRIVLEHPEGGVDLHAEMARRFMESGGVSGGPDDMPVDPFVGPPKQFTETPAQATARDATTRATGQVMSGEPGSQPVPGSYDQENPESLAAVHDQGQRLAQEQGKGQNAAPPPSKFPGVAPPGKQPAAQTPVAHHGGGAPAPADDQPLPGIEQRANISDISSADVQGKQDTANAIAQKQIADQQQARIDRSDELDKAIQSNWQRLAQQHEDLINQYLSAQVDPNRVWNNMDTGHKILAGVSMLLGPLGGVANMIGGGPVGGIQNVINQDVQNQKDQIERTGKAAGMVGELMDHYSKMRMDTASAMQMAVTTAQKIGEQRALQIASSFGGDRAHAALGQQFMKNDQSQKTIQDIAAGTTLKKAQANQAYSEAALNKLRGGQISGGNMVRDLDGNDGMARTPEIANAYNTGLEPARAIMQDVNDVEGARASGRVMNAGELKEYGDNLASHVLTLRGAKDNPRAMEMVDTLRKKPGEIFNFMPGKGWEQTRTAVLQMARDHDTVLKQDPRLSFRQGPPPPGFAPTTPRP